MKANELLRTIVLDTLLLIPFAVYAQDGEDVTSLYIINAGFDEDLTFQADGTKKAAIDTETSLSDRSWAYITEDSTVYARPKDSSSQQRPDGRKAEAVNGFIGWIKGWKPITNQDYPMCEWIYYGAVPYSLGADAVPISDDSNTFITAPDKLSAYNTEDNIGVLYLRSGWGNQCKYQQTTTLPKGSYQLEYWTININSSSSAEAEDITNVSFIDESTEVVFKDDSGTAFSSHEWVKHSISFSLKEATECTITFGFKAANAGSNANPWNCIDGVKLIATDSSSTTPDIITFADEKVKEICVANWDKDGDGELSYDEAAAVTSLGEVFQSNGSIYSFDELKHFTGLTSIDAWAFSYCYNLNVVTFPPTITSIGDYAFTCCYRIYSLTFPEGLISIGAFAFESIYYNLTSITIPNSVTTIGEKAFQECREVTSVTVYNPTPISLLDNDVFYATSNNATLYVPKGSKQAYMEADGWRQFAKIEEIADSTTITINETNFPDENFRKWLLEQDFGSDGELTAEEIAAVTEIDVSEKEIQSLKGIEFFTALTLLECGSNQLTELDVSKNTALIYLRCRVNKLTALDVSKNTALSELECYANQLTTLDVSHNNALTWLQCMANQLTALDVSQNTSLTLLDCTSNQLTTLDVSHNNALTQLFCAWQDSKQNRLLYVIDKAYGTFEVDGWNIIRGGQAEEVVLVDNEPLYIPEPFTAQHISYTHNFSKETQRGVASGWESLVLPFDVQSISCDSVEIVPFGANAVGYNKFWLAEVNPETGFTAATSIEANKPYILAMPNSTKYGSGNITGSVTFSATNVTVQPTSNEKTECAAFALTPCWSHINDTDSTYNEIYVLNDEAYTAPNQTVYPAGSVFVRSLRPVRPFEAYYTPANGAGVKEFFPISEMANGLQQIHNAQFIMHNEAGAVFDLSGRRSLSPSPSPVREGRAGVYIKDGRKLTVK